MPAQNPNAGNLPGGVGSTNPPDKMPQKFNFLPKLHYKSRFPILTIAGIFLGLSLFLSVLSMPVLATGGIDPPLLNVTSECLDGVNARVHLTWDVTLNAPDPPDTQFNIFKDGNYTATVTGTAWDSDPEAGGQVHSWNVMGIPSGLISNTVDERTHPCGTVMHGGTEGISVEPHSCKGPRIEGDVYSNQRVVMVSDSGSSRCIIDGNLSYVTNLRGDPVVLGSINHPVPVKPLPAIDLDVWKNLAASTGNIISGDLEYRGGTHYLGPAKIEGKLILKNDATLIVTGPIYATEYMDLQESSVILDDSLGSNGTVLVSDQAIRVEKVQANNASPRGFILFASTSTRLTQGSEDLDWSDAPITIDPTYHNPDYRMELIAYAPSGTVKIHVQENTITEGAIYGQGIRINDGPGVVRLPGDLRFPVPPPLPPSPTPTPTPVPSQSASATPTPPAGCTGEIIGNRWSVTDGQPFDPALGFPGATVSIWGPSGNYQFGSSPSFYGQTLSADPAGTDYNVSVTGVAGWRVHAEVWSDTGADGVYTTQPPDLGTAVDIPLVCGETVNVWFYFENIAGAPASVTPTPVPSQSASATPTPPAGCTGEIIGNRWSVTDSQPFDPALGFFGTTVSIWGNSGNYQFGPSPSFYGQNLPAGVPGLDYNVSVTGVAGWRVHAEVWSDGASDGIYITSPPGLGTAVDVPLSCNESVNVWFFFENLGAPASVTPTPGPALPDLTVQSISFDKDPFPTYQANETVLADIIVENIGPIDANNVNVKFYADLGGIPPSCSTPGETASTSLDIAANSQAPVWRFTFAAPGSNGDKTGWAIACFTPQSNYGNDTKDKTYKVQGVGGWFETTQGDVASRGAIKINQAVPAGRFQSSYLLAGLNVDSSAKTQRWKLTGYNKDLVPRGSVYDYFVSRFLAEARGNPCNIDVNSQGLRYCSGTQTIGAALNLSGTNAVWFIDGDLIVNSDITVDSQSTAMFIVKGNILVSTNVTRLDGVYVAGGRFEDSDAASPDGRQLIMDGAVYAQSVSLPRLLGGPNCLSGVACDNSATPSLVINFQPKYLMQLTSLLGSPSFLWREVEP